MLTSVPLSRPHLQSRLAYYHPPYSYPFYIPTSSQALVFSNSSTSLSREPGVSRTCTLFAIPHPSALLFLISTVCWNENNKSLVKVKYEVQFPSTVFWIKDCMCETPQKISDLYIYTHLHMWVFTHTYLCISKHSLYVFLWIYLSIYLLFDALTYTKIAKVITHLMYDGLKWGSLMHRYAL